jgi:hypothetical protein
MFWNLKGVRGNNNYSSNDDSNYNLRNSEKTTDRRLVLRIAIDEESGHSQTPIALNTSSFTAWNMDQSVVAFKIFAPNSVEI